MAYINSDFIDNFINQLDIVDIINKRIVLKKAGKDYKARCPFHKEKTPSFVVSPQKQIYHCFGCGAGGNAVKFIQDYEHLDFVPAIEALAKEYNTDVIYDTINQNTNPKDNKHAEYKVLMNRINSYFKKCLRQNRAKNKAVLYAKKRKIAGKIAQRFELGYVPAGWDNLYIEFKGDAEDIINLEKMGLIIKKENNDYYDRFRDRLMFPIHNRLGDIIGFGGRTLNDNIKEAKYINSPETPIFYKGRELYGLYQLRKHSKNIDFIIVVEGYMDVVAMHQHNITTTVATLGTAISEAQLNTLSRTTKNIIFCFDGDDGGKNAAIRAMSESLKVMNAGITYKFLFLDQGEDPDSLLHKKGRSYFLELITNAMPLSNFLIEHLKNSVDFKTIEGKTHFVENAKEYINLVKNAIYKKHLIKAIAIEVEQEEADINKLLSENKKEINKTNDNYSDYPDFSNYTDNTNVDIDNVIPNIAYKTKKPSLTKKTPIARAISLLLNYPIIVKEIDLSKIKKIIDNKIFIELIESAQLDENITIKDLLKPFKNSKEIKRLNELTKIEACDNEKQAQVEFLEIITKLDKNKLQQKINKLKHKTKLTSAEEIELVKLLKEKVKN